MSFSLTIVSSDTWCSKHRNNLQNLERNVGRHAFNEGAEIKPFMKVPVLERRQSEPLVDENHDEFWAGLIGIGTPPQQFNMDFDSAYSYHPFRARQSTNIAV